MYVVSRNILTKDYTIEHFKGSAYIHPKEFNHGLNEFFIVNTQYELNILLERLEKEYGNS